MPNKAQILKQAINKEPVLLNKLKEIYSSEDLIEKKRLQLIALIDSEYFQDQENLTLARCPGRISLSKHADYINSDLLYLLDDRDVFVAGQITEAGECSELRLINSNHNFIDLCFEYSELDKYLEDKTAWYFYPLKIMQKLGIKLNNKSLTLNITSDLPTGSGLSSSHALMISSYLALQNLFKLKRKTDKELIFFYQEVESERGFKSGLGDQSAQLLSKKNQFSFIKLFPELKVEYREIPENFAIVTAPSFIKADKSLPEFAAANKNIEKYKNINKLVKNLGVEYLADLLYVKTEAEIFIFLETITDIDLKQLALYGLAEAARVKNLKEESLSLDSIGKHLNLSHQAEQVSMTILETCPKLIENELGELRPLALTLQTGYYGASTVENDAIKYLATSYEGVYGASISGAGLGGNDIIVCHKDFATSVKEKLIQDYYLPRGLEEKARERVHISSFTAKANLILE